MDPFDLGSIFKMFEGLVPNQGGGSFIIMGPPKDGDGVQLPPGSSGCGCDDEQPSNKSPRDDVLKSNDPRQDMYSHYGQQKSSPRNEILKRPDVDHRQGGRHPGFEGLFFDDMDRDFMQSFFDPFSHRRPRDAFDDFGLFRGLDPFDPFASMRQNQHHDQRGIKEDVDLDSDVKSGRLSSLFDGGYSNSSKITTRSDGFFRKQTTWVDSDGNKQVKIVTRDHNGLETEKIEKHLPNGNVETIESKRQIPSRGRNNEDFNNIRLGSSNSFDSINLFKKPLFKSELFTPPKDSDNEDETKDNFTNNNYHQRNATDQLSFGFRRLLKHFLYGD